MLVAPATPEPPATEPTVTQNPSPPQPVVPVEEVKKPMPKEAKKPNKPARAASNETVLARAKQMLRGEKRKIWEQLGIEGDFDESRFGEAIATLAKARADANGKVEQVAGKAEKAEAELGQLRAKLTDTQAKLSKATRELQQRTNELEEFRAESIVRDAAREAGVRDVDYGIELFKRHIKGLPENEEPDAAGFFTKLKADPKKKILFEAEDVLAGPKAGADTKLPQIGQQGAPQGQQPLPDQGPPKPANGASPAAPPDALTMKKGEFQKYARETYGYSPGQG